MKLIRNRVDARWLPGRFNLALFRLLAFFVCRSAKLERQVGLVLAIDRHQSAMENYAVAAWIVVSLSIYAFAALRLALVTWVAALLAIPVALFLVHALPLSLVFAPRKWRYRNNIRLNAVIFMAMMIFASAYVTRTAHWTRVVGWISLALTALNALAAIALWFLRPRMAALERSFENQS